MPMFIRKILHGLYLSIAKLVVKFSPGARHMVYAGSGSASQLCEHIARTGVKRLLIVTDKPLRDLGIVDQATQALASTDITVSIYDGVLPDPTFEQVAEGAAMGKAQNCEAILAIGGGSSMDAAKIISASMTSDESPANWVGFGKLKHEVLPVFAIPTTSGTGSEATMGAVIKDAATHEKHIISGGTLLPVVSALDPDLVAGLPPHITAATGMDALTHGIEAYIGVWERGTRKEDARMAVKLVFENLAKAYHDGSDKQARDGMAMGAYYAGLAINQVNVGNVHAIAHQLGGKYGIPHGLANALVLPHILEFCKDEARADLATLAVLVGLGNAGDDESTLANKFIQAVRDLRTEVGIPDQSELIKREDFEDIVKLAIAEGDTYPTPRLLDRDSVLVVLNQIAA
ncbi:MAG: iron-containing alcohol dehydrogenase [Gammaproteobacteria bacterium]|jgi:alcohol dehydrogenase class IV|nr:iron-containing alcohol dehydrogenase [Gammaproteobacteria bacterium]